VQFDAVDAGGDRELGGAHEGGLHAREVRRIHRLGHRVRLHAGLVGPHLAVGAIAEGASSGPGARGQVELVADAAGVHQLHHQLAAALVHGLGDLAPGARLRRG
jgi:hypothetical protein